MGTPWRRFLTPARRGQTTSRIARPNSDDDGSGSPSLGDVTCASGTQLHVGAGDRRVVTTGSAASNDARWPRGVVAGIHADYGGSTRLHHTIDGSWHTSHGHGSARTDEHRRLSQCRDLDMHGAMPGRLAQEVRLPRQRTTCRSGSFDFTPGPGGPAVFQRQDGIGRRLLGNGRRLRPVIPASRGQRTARQPKGTPPDHGRHAAHCRPRRRRCPPENECLHLRPFERPAMDGAGAPA